MPFIVDNPLTPNYNLIRFMRHFAQSRFKRHSLFSLKENGYYAETIPVLQKALGWPIDKIVRTVELSILLRYEWIEHLYWLDNRTTFCDFFSLDYNSSRYEISVIKDFVIFSVSDNCSNQSINIEEVYKYETDLFLDFDDRAPNDIGKMEEEFEHYRSLLDIEMPSDLTKELMFEFLDICDSRFNISNTTLWDIFHSELHKVYKDDSEISPVELASKILKDPYVFCFLISYVKANNLFEINNDTILQRLHPHFIIAFREFWWKCEVVGNNKEVLNQQLKRRIYSPCESRVLEFWETDKWRSKLGCSRRYFIGEENLEYYKKTYKQEWYELDRLFSIGTELTYKYNAFCIHSELNGIDLKMNKDYMNPDNLLFKNVIPPKEPILNEHFAALVAKEGNISVSNEYCKKSEDESGNGVANHNCSDTNEEEKEKMRLMCSILSPDIDKEKADEIFSILRSMVEGGKGKRMVTIMLGAIKAGLINVRPTYNEWVKLGFDFGKSKGYYKILKEVTDDNNGTYYYRKYPEIDVYCERLLLIKAKYSNNRDSSLS